MDLLAVGSPEFDTVAKYITDTYPNACIMSIEKIQSPPHLEEYEALKQNMAEPNERTLFHGTRFENSEAIVRSGYDPTLNVTSAYGRGTYFATNASMSSTFMRNAQIGNFTLAHMLVNTVLVGKPVVYGTSAARQSDAVIVNAATNPTIFVVASPTAAIPRYRVAFYTGAEENALEVALKRKPRKARR